MADIEVVSKRENQLLKRTEVTFRITHPKEKTPQRGAVRDKIAATVGGKKEGVIISYMRSNYGKPVSHGYAKVYESADAAKKMEPKHILIRHGLMEKVAKTAGAAPAKKEEKAAAHAPAKKEEKAAAPAPAKKEEKAPAPAPAKKEEKAPAPAPAKK